jgi:hypothetical protein
MGARGAPTVSATWRSCGSWSAAAAPFLPAFPIFEIVIAIAS